MRTFGKQQKIPKNQSSQGFLELLSGFEPETSSLPITFCTFSTLPAFCPLSSLSLVAQYFPAFSVLFFCLLALAFLNLFGVSVWFLSGFLSATLTADLIPIGQKTRHKAPPLAFDSILCYPDLGAAGQQRSALLTEGSFFALRSSERRAAREYIRSSSTLFGHHWYLQPVYSGKKEVTAGTLTSTAITSSSL